MKLKSVIAAAVLGTVGVAAQAGFYTFDGALPSGVVFTETTAFAGGGASFGSSSYDLYSVTLSPLGLPTMPMLVQEGTSFGPLDVLETMIYGAGSYYAVATGSGTTSGYYSTTPVPEPETYAMMLAGLGVMGFVAARRKV